MKLYAKIIGTEQEVREYMKGAARMLDELADTKEWKEKPTAELLEELLTASSDIVVLFSRLT